MKLVTKDADTAYLESLKELLEKNGIPAFVLGENVARVLPPIAMTQPGLWVYLDCQFDDAAKLIHDPEYRVVAGIDVEAFYKNQPNIDEQYHRLNRTLIRLALFFAAILVSMFLLAKFLERM